MLTYFVLSAENNDPTLFLRVSERTKPDMTGKILDEILEAEKRAADIKKEALAKAAEIVSEATQSGEALCREVKQRATSRKKDLAAHSARTGSEALAKAREEAENKALIVCGAASANIPDAVNFIIGKVGSIWQ